MRDRPQMFPGILTVGYFSRNGVLPAAPAVRAPINSGPCWDASRITQSRATRVAHNQHLIGDATLIRVELHIPTDPCPDCHGSGKYTGLHSIEDCSTCGGAGVRIWNVRAIQPQIQSQPDCREFRGCGRLHGTVVTQVTKSSLRFSHTKRVLMNSNKGTVL